MAMSDLRLVEPVDVGPGIDLIAVDSCPVDLRVRNFVEVTSGIEGLTLRGACTVTSMCTMLMRLLDNAKSKGVYSGSPTRSSLVSVPIISPSLARVRIYSQTIGDECMMIIDPVHGMSEGWLMIVGE